MREFPYTVLAKVKFNDGIAAVLSEKVILKYKKDGDIIYGTDGVFYDCYYYKKPHGRFKAFSGRKFEIQLESGEIVYCDGQWWSGNIGIDEKVGKDLVRVTACDIKRLRECYVFHGYWADSEAWEWLLASHKRLGNIRYNYGQSGLSDSDVIGYWDYEKILRLDAFRRRNRKLESARKSLIAEVKRKHQDMSNVKHAQR